MALPLEGIRVLDMTIWQQGPYATAMLADMGADVVKIEGPSTPDPGRGLMRGGGLNGYFEAHNRNKRSLVLDLKLPQGRQVIQRLAARADVFVQNYRPGVAQRLGVDYATLAAINPGLIYATATGFGRRGPDAHLPAMDASAQARGGIMSVTGEGDVPSRTVSGLADQASAYLLAYGIVVALFHRQRTGQGQEVDSSLLQAVVNLQSFNITIHLFTGNLPSPPSRRRSSPTWNHYQGSDGRWFILSMAEVGRFWPQLCRAIGHEELIDQFAPTDMLQNPQRAMAVIEKLDAIFAQRPAQEWIDLLTKQGLLVAPVQDYAQVAQDPQVLENDVIVEVEHPNHGRLKMVGVAVNLSQTPGSIRRPAPEFGQHCEEVLLDYGFTWPEVEDLRRSGVIGPRVAAASP